MARSRSRKNIGNAELDLSVTFVRDSLLQQPVDNKIQCHVCERRCLLVNSGQGWCRTRVNKSGKLLTTSYGSVSSLAVNPIEKKPFYHFHPGSFTLTAGSWSCNFGCPWCQNWSISKVWDEKGRYVSPERFVQVAAESVCQGISISFNEPTLSLEWSVDVFRLARARRLYNTFVTNGYMTPESLQLLKDAGLDAMNVDMKGGAENVRKYCRGVDVEKIWAICDLACRLAVHLELTTLVIPTVNDSKEELRSIATRIANQLGPDVPWHVSGYYPAFDFSVAATPSSTLETAWQIGKEAGLRYVYVGNMPGHRYDNTQCPSCGDVLIRRIGFEVIQNSIKEGACPSCYCPISGVWDNTGKN